MTAGEQVAHYPIPCRVRVAAARRRLLARSDSDHIRANGVWTSDQPDEAVPSRVVGNTYRAYRMTVASVFVRVAHDPTRAPDLKQKYDSSTTSLIRIFGLAHHRSAAVTRA